MSEENLSDTTRAIQQRKLRQLREEKFQRNRKHIRELINKARING